MFHKYYCITLTKKETEYVITMLPPLHFIRSWLQQQVTTEDCN